VSAFVLALVLMTSGAVIASLTTRALVRVRSRLPEPKATDRKQRTPVNGFPFAVDDVVCALEREFWIERVWLLEEAGRRPRAALFFTQEAVLLARADHPAELYVSREIALALPPQAPRTVEDGSEIFERVARLPVTLYASNEAALPAVFAEFKSTFGDVLWIVTREGAHRVFRAPAAAAPAEALGVA
jgi:hypothetical protein